MPTPLYDALKAHMKTNPLPMHMPGHKGKATPMAEFLPLAPLDLTELPPTGNLFEGDDAIEQAERLWAAAFHMEGCLFLTGGATQGVHTALALTCRPGQRVLVDRGCHRSVYHAMGLLDLMPAYLGRPWLAAPGVTGPVSPQEVERQLAAHPDVKTVCITSPTYYGVLSDIPAIAAVCHRYGAKLVVDGAHGAHLPFLGNFGLSAADVAVVSAHKTLPAPGQSALLFVNGIPMQEVRRTGAVFGSSSPSYPMMAALDCVRDWMEGEGSRAYAQSARQVARLRERYPALTADHAPLDPTRFVLCCADGFRVRRQLEEQGVWPEMADAGHVVCILTCADGSEEFERLEGALQELDLGKPPAERWLPPPPARQVLSPRQALFAPVEQLSLCRAEGRICAQSVAPYPPGVPVIAPGERVDKNLLSYLKEIGYNSNVKVAVTVP